MSIKNGAETTIRVVLIVIAAGSLSNAIWMLLFPLNWFHNLPALVTEFGTFNVHFVRDMGCAFLTVGVALWWAVLKPDVRFAVTTIAAIFYATHAIVHIYDTGRGYVGSHHWWVDFPSSYLPAILLIGVVTYLYRSNTGRNKPAAE